MSNDDQPSIILGPGFISRRGLIVGAGATAGLAAVLAACGSDEAETKATDAPETTAGASETTAAAPTETTAAAPVETTAAPVETTPATEPAPTGEGKPGGIFRLGVIGADSDILDGQHIVSKADIARTLTGWEPLMSFSPDYVPEYTNGIAKDATATAPDEWVVTLKDGVKFSNGNPVTADDLIYSFDRVLDETSALFGGGALRPIMALGAVTKVDDSTVKMKLKQPVSNFKEALCAYTMSIVPKGYERFKAGDDPLKQVGTGAYMLTEFTPGKTSVHKKNPHYWDAGKPYFDEVHIVGFKDADAVLAALLDDQIDAAADIPSAQVETITGTEGYAVLNSSGGSWLDIVMAVDMEPFTDVRVRQAMRLIVDRDAMVEQVLSGYGSVANDLFSPLDANYIGDELPQREQDLEAAKKLLEEAGKAGMTVDLFAPDDTAALGDLITVFAEQAKGAGITVNAQVIPAADYWADGKYLKRAFATDYWGTRNFLPQVAASSLPTSPYPGDHWPPAGSTFIEDYNAALAETDEAKRKEITDKMQKELYETGGLIIPFFQNLLDGYNSRVKGLVERPNTLNLDHYGRGYKNIWFDEG